MNKPLTQAQTTRTALVEQSQAAPPPPRAGQATLVEQSRAIAEVQGAIVLAQQRPRDTVRAIADMRQSCGIKEMADSAFFAFPRGGSTISGPSVQLARELARCWGNIDYGIKELSRDDMHGQSEMLAFAWDLETNVRAETIFIVPHLRDKRGGPERLTDVRDIYEVNANMGARRLREQIFAVLPRWFTEQAETACHETLEKGGGEPLPIRISKMVEWFGQIGISKTQLEKKVGGSIDKIDAVVLANLGIVYKSIRRGELNAADEFPIDSASQAEATSNALRQQAEASEAPDGPAIPSSATQPEKNGQDEREKPAALRIPKRDAAKGGGFDYPALCDLLGEKIVAADTLDGVNAWQELNLDSLKAAEEAVPDAYSRLMAIVEKRIGELMAAE